MPPKGSRGRGRGKGGPAADAGSSRADPQTKDEPASSAESLTSIPPIELQIYVPTSASIAQQQDNVSPNLSPASAPTETPAPTPVRPPVQRLDSLGVSGRGSMGIGRGTGRAMAGKFKPKAVRRGAEERAEAEAEERARREERERAAQRELDSALRGRRGGCGDLERGRSMRGRGRGDAMGRGGLDRNRSLREATGLFGIAPAGGPGAKRATFHSGGWTGQTPGSSSRVTEMRTTTTTSDPGFKQEPNRDESMRDISDTPDLKREIPEPIYPEEIEGTKPARRIDIEQINLVTDDEGDDLPDVTAISGNKGKGYSVPSKGGLKPIRLQRAEHKDRVTMVNTESAAASLADGKGFGEETSTSGVFKWQGDDGHEEETGGHNFDREGKIWSGAWRDDEMQVKADPEAAADVMEGALDISTSVPNADLGGYADDLLDHDEPTTSIRESDRPKGLRKLRDKEKKPVLQTEEDRAEYERHLEDIRILTEELGSMQRSLPAEKYINVIDLEQIDEPRVKDKEGRLYLFQFPPVLPPLINKIKKEEPADGDVDMMQAAATTVTATTPVDLTQPDNELDFLIKTEERLNPAPAPKSGLVMEEGSIGKLTIRKSGKVELDWGGTILKLGRGVETSFLTTTVVIDDLPQQTNEEAAGLGLKRPSNTVTGTAVGMGKVMGKFVATPDFDQMLDLE